MPLNLGSSAVSLYLGDQSVTAHLGEVRVTPATLPAAPTVKNASEIDAVANVSVSIANSLNGGSEVTGFVYYLNGSEVTPDFQSVTPSFGQVSGFAFFAGSAGQTVEVAAVNAVGEGPKSDPFTVIATE